MRSTYFTRAVSGTRSGCQCLIDVGDDVAYFFYSDRNPDQAIADAQLFPPRWRQIAMRRCSRMHHAGEYIAEAGRTHAKANRIHKTKCGFAAVVV
jgi:hypothetical protein